jgi:hypothetical protein
VPAHFRRYQNTFGDPRTLLTVKIAFGISSNVLETPKYLWKLKKRCGTVPALLAPVYLFCKHSNPANTGTRHLLPATLAGKPGVKQIACL